MQNWQPIEQFSTAAEAFLARDFLRAQGFECELRGEKVASLAGPVSEYNLSWQNPLGGVEIIVPEDQSEAARAILQETKREIRPAKRGAPIWFQILAAGSAGSLVFYVGAIIDLRLGSLFALLTFFGLLILARRTKGN